MEVFKLSYAIRKLIAKLTGAEIKDGKGKNGGKAFAIGKGSRAIGGDAGKSYEDR